MKYQEINKVRLRIKLSESEPRGLEEVRRKTEDARNIIRAYMVMLNAQGLRVPEIAEQLRKNKHTVRNWIKRYKNKGIDKLGLSDGYIFLICARAFFVSCVPNF